MSNASKRSVLIPEEFFHKFMEYLNNSDLSALANTKQSMQKLMDNRNMDLNKRDLMYNQHQQTFLQKKLINDEKPMRMVLASPPSTPRSPSPDRPFVSVWPPPAPSVPQAPIFAPQPPPPQTPPSGSTMLPGLIHAPRPGSSSYRFATSRPYSASTPRKSRKANKADIQKVYVNKAQEILAKIDLRGIGVAPNGQFLTNQGKPYRDSQPNDALRAIIELLGKPQIYNKSGGNKLQHILRSQYPNIMKEIQNFKSTVRKGQAGDGWVLSKKSPDPKVPKKFVAPRWRVIK